MSVLQKIKKKPVAVNFGKKYHVGQKERKNNLSQGKIPGPPPWISNGPSLNKQCIDQSLTDENIKETFIKHLVGYNGIIFSSGNLMKTYTQPFNAI